MIRSHSWLLIGFLLPFTAWHPAGKPRAFDAGITERTALSDALVDKQERAAENGVLEGYIRYRGNPPRPAKLPVTLDRYRCGSADKMSKALLIGRKKGIENVVVLLAPEASDPVDELDSRRYTMDQIQCEFTPHVLVVPAGATVDFLNSDDILHNVNAESSANPAFNRAQPNSETPISRAFQFPEAIPIQCFVHSWMQAWVFVTDKPYFTLTDSNGFFRIEGVPSGLTTLTVWHESLGEITQGVTISPEDPTTIELFLGPLAQ